MTAGILAEKIALELLARDGASAVWQLHVVAAKVYRDGGARAAGVLLVSVRKHVDSAESVVIQEGRLGWGAADVDQGEPGAV